MRVAVTGAGGRLGSALVTALADAPFTGPAGPIAWRRDAFDLDAPDGIGARLDRDRPEVVVHAAASTDVDGCALDPELAVRRNGTATGVLAAACAERGTDLLLVSTNEVFSGERRDGRPWEPSDPDRARQPVRCIEARGRAARHPGIRRAARRCVRDRPDGVAVRGPGPRLPQPHPRCRRACPGRWRARPRRRRRVGTPTYTADVADAIVELLAEDAVGGIHHLVNGLTATRADWARYVVARAGSRSRS